MVEKPVPENFYEIIKPRLHRKIGLELRLAGCVLDLGCGSCDLVRYLADSYHQRVTGVDISRGSFPRNRRSQRGVRFHCMKRNAANLKFVVDQSFDAVVTMWALHEMGRPEAILMEAHRALRPGGEVLIVDFPRDSLAQRLWDEAYYRPDQIKNLLAEAGFTNIRVRLIERGQVIWARAFRPPAEATT